MDSAVNLGDWPTWLLTPRTTSWFTILWLVDVRPNSPYVPLRARNIPDPNRQALKAACDWAGSFFDEGDDSWRPMVHFNCDSTVVAHALARNPVRTDFWVNDDLYTGQLVLVERNQVQKWLKATKVIFVYDCDSAAMFLRGVNDGNYHLAACAMGENLPNRDMFSKLLTFPVQTAYDYYCFRTDRPAAMLEIPGALTDRQMLKGQLDWVLTMITDAIAWESMPREAFYELFRKDLLTATVFRRFILSQRLMKTFDCNVVSNRELPDCSRHQLWGVWDHLMEITVMLVLGGPNQRDCPIVPTFFRIILGDFYQNYPNLLLPALTLPAERLRALDLLNVCWTKISTDRQLQKAILNQVTLLLHSEDNGIRRKAIKCLIELIVNGSQLDQLLTSNVDINLCANLGAETNPGLITQILFLQILFERNSTRTNPNHKQALGTVCSQLMSHPEGKVRTWSVLLAATLSDNDFPGLRNRLQDLLSDPVPKVRAAALERWISSYNRQADHQDIYLARLLSMLSTNSSSFVRREVADTLIAVLVTNRMKDLLTICKQELTGAKQQPEPTKSKGKAKAKQQPKKGSPTTKSDTELGRAWRLMVALQTDPDQTVASSMRSVMTFVKERVAELESNDKKRKKKAIAEPKFPLPTRKPLFDRFRLDLLDEAAEPVEEAPTKEFDSMVLKGPTVSRNPTAALLNHQLKSFRVQKVPEMVRFGPDRQMVTVCKDDVTWQVYTTECKAHLKSPAKVTSLLMNPPQHRSTLLVGYVDGSVRMWQSDWKTDPTPTAGWPALYDFDNAPPYKAHGISMALLGAGQLIAGGDAKYLRKWDLAKELSLGDVSIGTDQAVTALVSNGSYNVVAGLENGTVRLFDLRAEADGKIAVGPKHGSPVRAVSLRPDGLSLVSVCSGGSVHLMDLRKMIPAMKKWSVDAVPVDVAIHERLDALAFAGNGSLEMYSIEGERICGREGGGEGAVCVGFHPREPLLGAGYRRDGGTVVLYGEGKI